MALFGVAALVGTGFVIGKKLTQKKAEKEEFFDFDDFEDGIEDLLDDDDESDVFAASKSSFSDKCKKASMFAVGAIKTGADKFGETIQDIKTKDMVKKGEQTVGAVKNTGDNIKNDLKRDMEDLKSEISSIKDEVKEDIKEDFND
jgi:gas vesicle protein